MAAQPNHILYPKFENAVTYGSNDTTTYYYKDGKIYIENGVNLNEFKRMIPLDTEGRGRTTRLKYRGQSINITTDGGTSIESDVNDEIWMQHNYAGNLDTSRLYSSVSNSWWYDVDKHREYRIFLVFGYNDSKVINGETYYNWRVKRAYIEYNDADQDTNTGTFRFSSRPNSRIQITGSATITSTAQTWQEATLKVYKHQQDGRNPELVDSEEVTGLSGVVNQTLTLQTSLRPTEIDPGERLSLALEVGDKPSGMASALKVTNYSLEINGGEGEYVPREPVYLGLSSGFDLSEDCNPLLNNVSTGRENNDLQVVEFELNDLGQGIAFPSNIEEILINQARKAEVPASNYTQRGPIQGKYNGSKLTRTEINSFDFPSNGHLNGSGLNSLEFRVTSNEEQTFNVVDIRDTNLGYFNQIIDPYPVLNGKTAYFVKYLINSNGTVQDPSLSEIGKITFENTFRDRNVNLRDALFTPSIPNDVNRQELLELRNPTKLFKRGEYPFPVLWSQTSATTYTENLPLTGAADFYSSTAIDVDTYDNLAFRTSDPSIEGLPVQGNINQIVANFGEEIIKPNTIEYIGFNNAEIYENDEIEFPSEALTDSYSLNGRFTFYTTPVPVRTDRVWVFPTGWKTSRYPRSYGKFAFTIFKNTPFRPQNVSVRVFYEAGANDPNNIQTLGSGTIEIGRSYGGVRIANYESNRLVIDFHSLIQREIITGVNDRLSPEDGHRLKFVISFSMPTGQIRPSDDISFRFRVYNTFIHTGEQREDDDPTGQGSWARSIFPNIPGNPSTAELEVSLLGAHTQDTEEINTVNAPYWSQEGLPTNQIKLVSEHLNTRYASNFYQGNLPYTPTTNPVFPAAQEPNFISFPGATDQFEIFPGDEIRFENNENESYTVVNTIQGDQLIVTLDRPLSSGRNLDFFLIRRYKPLDNVIILDQQKPYSFPPSASSSPGLILPEYLDEDLETSPDAVITNLIERNLIE